MATGSSATGSERVILMAMDGLSQSEFAFEWYLRNVYKENDRILLLVVVDVSEFIPPTLPFTDTNAIAESMAVESVRISGLLQSLQQLLMDKQLRGNVMLKHGSPGPTIVDTAQEEKAEMIVIGSGSLGRFRLPLLGSLSDYVVHNSRISVVVCKQG